MANKFYTSEKWLRRQHHELRRSIEDIAKSCGVSQMTIYRAMDNFGIKVIRTK